MVVSQFGLNWRSGQAKFNIGQHWLRTSVHLEGFWSLLRSWLRPHRGIPQESLPLYLGFFEFVHNVRARGKRLLESLIGLLLAPPCNPS
jgi:transposase-like protein